MCPRRTSGLLLCMTFLRTWLGDRTEIKIAIDLADVQSRRANFKKRAAVELVKLFHSKFRGETRRQFLSLSHCFRGCTVQYLTRVAPLFPLP